MVSRLEVDGPVLTYSNDCVSALLDPFFLGAEFPVPQLVCGAIDPLKVGEVDYMFPRVRSKRSLSMEGMTKEINKSIWKAISEFLMILFEKCLGEGYSSPVWKDARAMLLLKSPDKTRSNVRFYLDISLFPVLCKMLEKVIVQRLQERIRGRESQRQFSFKPGLDIKN